MQNTLFLKDLELRAITLEQFKEIKEKGFPEREEAAAKQEAQKAGENGPGRAAVTARKTAFPCRQAA